MGRHSLRHMDVMPMTIVGVHSVRMWRRPLMSTCWVLHHSSPLDLHPLDHFMRMQPLCWRGCGRDVMGYRLVCCREMLWDWSSCIG